MKGQCLEQAPAWFQPYLSERMQLSLVDTCPNIAAVMKTDCSQQLQQNISNLSAVTSCLGGECSPLIG